MNDEASNPLGRAVEELSYFAQRLDTYGRVVVLTTLMHVALAFFAAVFTMTGDRVGLRAFNTWDVRLLMLAADLCILVFSIFSLARFERVAKQGEVYFTEIANEKNWGGEDEDRLRFDYRIALREFSISSELPLARGKGGVSVYLLLNGAITLVVWGLLLLAFKQNTAF